MAKDLPYFKFFCSEWNDGDITLESYESQGLFVNICSYYWSNNCEVTLAKLKKKFKQDDLIDSLISEGIFKVEGDDVVISFLIEQLGERDTLSSQNSVNAKKRWDKIREDKRLKCESNATASKPQCESGTESMQYREEKRREEEIREEKKIEESKKAKAFDLFWSKYPKKVAKDKCKIKFIKLSKDDINKIIKTIDGFITYKPFDTYTHPNPMTYLNQSRWNDEKEVKVIERTKQEIYEEELAKVLKDKYK
tara:strand:- start:2313 stop:3065 length:753 start_codon:yes stop_codon:yes gene_type:complete